MLESYLQYIQEGYLLSNKTINIGLSDFESGESNILLVAGIPASGKSTVGKKLAKKYKAIYFETDACLNNEKALNGKYIKDPDDCFRQSFRYAKKSKKRYVMEGVLVYWSCIKMDNKTLHPFFNEIKNTPIVILRTSFMKAIYRGLMREKGKAPLKKIINWYVINNIKDMKVLDVFRRARTKQ